MGRGIVLIVWGIVFTILAVVARAMLQWLLPGRDVPSLRRTRGLALALPFAWLPYAAACFVVFSFWCETRGIDPGLGDCWELPLGHGYRWLMIDVTETSYIAGPGNGLLAEFDRLDVSGDHVFGHLAAAVENAGRTPPHAAFADFDVTTGTLHYAASREELELRAGRTLALVPPTAFYRRQRPLTGDLALLAAAVGLPAMVLAALWLRLWRGRARLA